VPSKVGSPCWQAGALALVISYYIVLGMDFRGDDAEVVEALVCKPILVVRVPPLPPNRAGS
jgi:hypothetical protein